MDVLTPSNPSTLPSSSSSSLPALYSADAHITTNGTAPNGRHSFPRTVERSQTDIRPSSLKVKKRIIVCCDGTWQDGLVISERWKYTNILRLSRAIHHVDERFMPPVPQVVFYQAGVGTDSNPSQALLDGAVGAGLADKVQEAYAFIAHNYGPGDEIFLFGFSRGAYTARMIAMVIREIGVLDRTDMDNFAHIFIDLQARGKSQDKDQIESLNAKLAPWTRHDSPSKARADYDGDSFVIKCVGVFDTVGSLGLPEELSFGSKKIKTLFGFPDSILGDHVERAFQALALNETRADFTSNKFHLSEEGRRKNQVLNQCWFAGCHSDIGGGYKEHDLSDITLFWMAANIENILSIDTKYLFSLLQPHAPWGAQKPHDPRTGVFALSNAMQRQPPTSFNPITHESIHPSVLVQGAISPQLTNTLATHPDLVCQLMPLEEQAKQHWRCVPGKNSSNGDTDVMDTLMEVVKEEVSVGRRQSFIAKTVKTLRGRVRGLGGDQIVQSQSVGMQVQRSERSGAAASETLTSGERNWLSRLMQETSLGHFIRELV